LRQYSPPIEQHFRDGRAELLAELAEALRPSPPVSVSGWAQRDRRLTTADSPFPGRWRNERTPYLVEPMDCLAPTHPARRVVACMGWQLGKTNIGLNFLGHGMDTDPSPSLWVMPGLELARRFGSTRLQTMIDASPTLRALIDKGDADQTTLKTFPGGFIRVGIASSSDSLESDTIKRLVCDEVDQFPEDCEGKGDPVRLAEGRTSNYTDEAKILLVGKPAAPMGRSRMWQAYEQSDQRELWLRCPDCGTYQTLNWEQVRWPKKPERPLEAYYVCAADDCGSVWEEWQKPELLAGGEWRAQVESPTPGFHLSSLYSPFYTWGQMAQDYCEVRGDPEQLKAWVMSRLALPWNEQYMGDFESGELLDRREDYGKGPAGADRPDCPADVALLTAGVDVQQTRIEVSVWGWGDGEESWLIEHAILEGDTSIEWGPVWQDLERYLQGTWSSAAGAPLRVRAAGIDSSYRSDAVYAFCMKLSSQQRHWWAIKGRHQADRAIWPRRPEISPTDGRSQWYPVGLNQAKSLLRQRMRVADHGPGFVHFPLRVGREFLEQLTHERQEYRVVRGRRMPIWARPEGKAVEAWDCQVYALAVLRGLAQRHRCTTRDLIALARRGEVDSQYQRERRRPPVMRGDRPRIGANNNRFGRA